MVNSEHKTDTFEEEPDQQGSFERSADYLIDLAEAAEEDRSGLFFAVEWNEEGDIGFVEAVDISPTGARRQERHDGLYGQVQVRIRPIDTTAPVRFDWVKTQPRLANVVSDGDIERDLGYAPLTKNKVGEMMTARIQTLPEYLYLANQMTERNITPPSDFKEYALKMTKEFFNDKALGKVQKHTLKELEVILKGLNQQYASKVRHALLSDMLLPIVEEDTGREATYLSISDADEAMECLEEAFRVGVIPLKVTFIKRILAVKAIHRYPIGTKLLYTRLLQPPLKPDAQKLDGTPLTQLLSRYITTILQARGGDLGADTASSILQKFETSPDLSQEDDHDLIAYFKNLRGIGGEVFNALQEMQSTDPVEAVFQQETDVLSKEIIDMLLKPILSRKIGRAILMRGDYDAGQS